MFQNDNDLVFEDDLQVIRDHQPNNSSQVNSEYSNAVSLDNDILINTRDDRKSNDESLSEKISRHFRRFKREAWNPLSFLWKSSDESSSTVTATDTNTPSNTPMETRSKRQTAWTTLPQLKESVYN